MLLLVLWWFPDQVDLNGSFGSYNQHTVSGAIAASTVGKQDVHCATLSFGGGWMLSWFLEKTRHGRLSLTCSFGFPMCGLVALCAA